MQPEVRGETREKRRIPPSFSESTMLASVSTKRKAEYKMLLMTQGYKCLLGRTVYSEMKGKKHFHAVLPLDSSYPY